jgi:hypothetical protein
MVRVAAPSFQKTLLRGQFGPRVHESNSKVSKTFFRMAMYFKHAECCTASPCGSLVMLHNLPLLLPAQTLYSWCGMAHALNGGMRATETSSELFGAPYAGLCHDFPSNLDHLSKATGGSLGDPRRIAQQHTLLGYFLPLVDAAQADRILSMVCEGGIPQLKMQLGITASRLGGHHPLKGCRPCFTAAEQNSGNPFWRVDQQFPSSFVCSVHRSLLSTAWDSVTPVHRRSWLLPLSGQPRTWIDHDAVTEQQFRALERLQEDSCAFAILPAGCLDSCRLASTYRFGLHEAGMATPRGSLKLGKLAQMVRGHYAGLEHLPGMHVLSSITDDWPGLAASLARRVPRPGHPFKHLLLISCLFESWNAFMEAYSSTQDRQDEKACQVRLDPLATQRLQFKRLVETQKLSIRAASSQLGVSTTSGVQWAKQLGLSYKARPKSLTRRVETAIQRRLSRGETVEGIAASASVSVTTVRRVLGSNRETSQLRHACMIGKKRNVARRSFTALCSKNANIPLSSLRSVEGNSYAWLYRNDREWLATQLQKFGRTPRGH